MSNSTRACRASNFSLNPKLALMVGLLVLIFSSVALSQSKPRTWSSSDGKYKIKASLKKVEDQKATFEKEYKTEVEVPLEKLSSKDRNYIRTWLKKNKGSNKKKSAGQGSGGASSKDDETAPRMSFNNDVSILEPDGANWKPDSKKNFPGGKVGYLFATKVEAQPVDMALLTVIYDQVPKANRAKSISDQRRGFNDYLNKNFQNVRPGKFTLKPSVSNPKFFDMTVSDSEGNDIFFHCATWHGDRFHILIRARSSDKARAKKLAYLIKSIKKLEKPKSELD